MANYLERVVVSGARIAPQARPSVGAPPMLPGTQSPPVVARMEAAPERESRSSTTSAVLENVEEIERGEARPATAITAIPEPASVVAGFSSPLLERTAATPVESPRKAEPGRTVEIPVEPARLAECAPIIVKTAGEVHPPEGIEPAIPSQKPKPSQAPKTASPKPDAPVFFRFQQPPVHIDAPKELRPAKDESAIAPVPAPPEPISSPYRAILTPPRTQKSAPQPPLQPVATAQKPAEPPTPIQAPKASPVKAALPALAAPPSQKRIHIGAVEVHVHNQMPPTPKAAAPRPAAVNHADPFEQRSLGRFAFRL